MSLFKVRDLWSTKCGKDEIFDQGSLLVANISGDGGENIIVGSHSGCLRIFNPQLDFESGNHEQFKPIDLLIEVQLEQPILQLAVGKFVSGSKIDYLAILHPRSIIVYNFIAVSGSTEHGDQCQLNVVYEHHLKRSAYCLVVGGFGGVQGRDFICVLALDGTLLFYEQETLTTTKQLPIFLLPTPIAYVPHTDSFIVVNSNWHIESFRYQVLGEESSDQISPSWSFNLGEDIVEMEYVSLTTTEAAIFILTDRNFFCFTETGTVKFTKRLQYVPICCHIFTKGGEPLVMSMIVTDSNKLMIYEDTKLVWAAQLHFSPIAISRASLQGLEGCLVLLSEEGELECGYLGTEPTVFVPPPLQASVTSNSELESKLAALQHQIATYSRADKDSLGAPAEKSELKAAMKVWEVNESEGSCIIEISLVAASPVHNVNVSIECPQPFVAAPQALYISNISDKAEVSCLLKMSEEALAWELAVSAVCAYMVGEKCGVCSAEVQLPLRLVLELCQPTRGLEHSLNLTASQVVIIPALFQDFAAEAWQKSGSNEYLAGFRFRHRPEVAFTVTLNRPALKYRLEADLLTALTLPVCLMSKKLASKYLRCSQYSIGLAELFSAVERNVQLRNTMTEVEEELKQGSSQMRACQRRLLTKMRDKTPTDLSALSTLIEYTHNYVMEAAHKMEAAQKELEENGQHLANVIRLTMSLVKLSGSAADDEVDMLYEAMAYTDHFSENQGWAEITQIALSSLLKTTLARSVRDQFGSDPQDRLVTDSLALKKQIALAIDRVVRGQRRTNERAVSPIMEGEDEEGRDRSDLGSNDFGSEELKKIIEQAKLNLDHL